MFEAFAVSCPAMEEKGMEGMSLLPIIGMSGMSCLNIICSFLVYFF